MPAKPHQILITKASGVIMPFMEAKLRASLQRSGAKDSVIDEIIKEITPRLYPGITTHKIYKLAFNKLRERAKPVAAKYQLKRAIMELGPSGYPFEAFIGNLLKEQGYSVQVGQIVSGGCVNHEIDVIAENGKYFFMVECKYHNLTGSVCDVKIPLYIQARFEDIEKKWLETSGQKKELHSGWVVTNTRFTSDAVKYGTCAGLHLLSWDYPEKEGLKDQIDKLRLFPVTCLTSLTKSEKQKLLAEKIVLCKEITKEILSRTGINQIKISSVLKEVQQLLDHGAE